VNNVLGCVALVSGCVGFGSPAVAVVDGLPGGIAAGEIALWDALLLLSVWGPRGWVVAVVAGKKVRCC